MNIGIEQNTKLIYESTSTYGYPIWPSPVMLQVVITTDQKKTFKPEKSNNFAPNSFIFREDTYNTGSRIRRGRLYKAGDMQPVEWHLYPHPTLGEERKARDHGGTLRKQVYAYYSFRLKPYLDNQKIKDPIFLLGSDIGYTIWTLVNIESSATGDELIVLRSRKSIGALPKLYEEKIIKADGQSVIENIEKLEEEIFGAGPESVVDSCREAATAILSKYLQSVGKKNVKGKDLGALANITAEQKWDIVANSARIIARYHSRRKHAEQEKNNLRHISEQDAEYAVQAVGAILCDIGWGYW